MKNYMIALWVEVEKLSELKLVLDTPMPSISLLSTDVLPDNNFASHLSTPLLLPLM